MLLTWRGARICLHSGLQREDKDVSAHSKLRSATSRVVSFGASFHTENLLQTEAELSEDILLQKCQLIRFKHSKALRSCVSVGSPNLKDQQIASHSQYEMKNAFSVYQLCQDWSCHLILCHCQVLGIKVEVRTAQRKGPKCVIANLIMYLSDALIQSFMLVL